MRKLGLLTLALAVLSYAAAPALAQETKGSIEGTVKDATGGALPGATVDVKSASTAVQSTVTDGNGYFRFPTLQPGVYSVTATLQGFGPQTRDKIQLNAGAQLRVEMMLNVSGRSESVNVKAQTPIVDVKQNAVNTTITSEIIDLIPKDRSFLSALVGIAGVGQEDRGGGIMIDGAGASENRIIIDGMDTTNLQNGTVGKDVVVDFIDQIQVKQSGYAAEYRATTGGVISAITKSGSNQFHGEGGNYLSGKALVGLRGGQRPSLGITTPDATKPKERVATYTTPTRAASEFETTVINPIFSMSGPIFRNKMWFFTGYDPGMTLQSRQVQWSDTSCLNVNDANRQTATDCLLSNTTGQVVPRVQTFDAKTTNWQLSYNSTIQLTRSIRTRITGTNQRSTNSLSLPAISNDSFNQTGPTVSSSNPTQFNPRPTVHSEGFNDAWSGTVDWVMNNKMYANITSGFLNYGSGSKGGDYYHGIRRSFAVNNFTSTNILFADIPVDLQHAATFTDFPSNSFNIKNNYNRMTVNGDITRYADWRGQHALKTGFQFERFGNDVNTGAQYPTVTLSWGQTRTTLDQRQVTGKYGYYTVGQQWTVGNIHSNNMGLFLQDQWTFNNKLTLNYGIRFDRTNIPSYRTTTPGLTFNWASKVAPRLGFAYDMKGDAKWKAYGSWGVFYDIEKLELPRGAWGAETWNTYYYTLDDFDWTKINCLGPDGTGCPGTYIEQNDLRHVSNDPNDPSHNTVDPNLKPYKAEELVFGLDHELNRLMSIGVRYAHKWIDRGIEDVGISVPGLGELFYIANPGYGLGAYPYGPSFPRTPFPVRHYDGVDINWRRRIQNNWSLTAAVTFSRTYGNYGGLTSSDENGRNSPGVNRYYDGIFMNFTEKGCPTHDTPTCVDQGIVTYGLLPTDRPVVAKLTGTYITPWGTSVGVSFWAGSGTLNSSSVTYKGVPVFIYGRGNVGRDPVLNYTDINFQHFFRLPHRMKATLQLDVKNLFDQDTQAARGSAAGMFTGLYQSGSLTLNGDSVSAGPFFAGFDTKARFAELAATQSATSTAFLPDPRFGLANSFYSPRRATLYIKFQF